jgi:hypothetical protein
MQCNVCMYVCMYVNLYIYICIYVNRTCAGAKPTEISQVFSTGYFGKEYDPAPLSPWHCNCLLRRCVSRSMASWRLSWTRAWAPWVPDLFVNCTRFWMPGITHPPDQGLDLARWRGCILRLGFQRSQQQHGQPSRFYNMLWVDWSRNLGSSLDNEVVGGELWGFTVLLFVFDVYITN